MSQKLPDIRFKQIGKNLNVIIGDEPTTITGDKEVLEPIKEKLKKYLEKKSPTLLKEIQALVKPKTTKEVKEKEQQKVAAIAAKKSTKRAIKETEKENKEELKEDKKANSKRTSALKGLIGTTLVQNGTDFFLKGYESVKMPELLVDRFIDFVNLGRTLQPLINFWMWCLLNPNKIARYKLFAYLSKQRLIITPSGYFVAYRMVKKTPDSDATGIYVDAHTGKFQHIIGKVSKMDRADCDEEGSNACSSGLHVGSPDFIGIKLGDGYNKGEIKTKKQGGGYGTGYGAPEEVVTQKFDNTFGNQAVICLVNPMHVVSVPNYDERKMRACQLYIAKTTTAEEVLHHLTEADYLIFDDEYASIESDELKKALNGVTLEDYSDGSVEQKAKKGKESPAAKKLRELKASLNNFKVANDPVADDISPDEIMKIVSSRVITAPKAKKENPTEKLAEVIDAVADKEAASKRTVKSNPKSGKADSEKVKKAIKQAAEEGEKVADAVLGKKETAKKPAKTKVDEDALKTFVLDEWARRKKAKKSPKNFWVLKVDTGFKSFELSKGEAPEPTTDLLGNLDALNEKFSK